MSVTHNMEESRFYTVGATVVLAPLVCAFISVYIGHLSSAIK